jgi:hypothetical protein
MLIDDLMSVAIRALTADNGRLTATAGAAGMSRRLAAAKFTSHSSEFLIRQLRESELYLVDEN